MADTQDRDSRRAAALRENLKKRKGQARGGFGAGVARGSPIDDDTAPARDKDDG